MKKAKKAKMPGADLENSLPSAQPVQEPKEPDDIMDNYKARDHLDTIIKAHNIQQDPEKMAKVHELAGRHMEAIQGLSAPKSAVSSTDDLRKLRNKKYGKQGMMPDSDNDGE